MASSCQHQLCDRGLHADVQADDLHDKVSLNETLSSGHCQTPVADGGGRAVVDENDAPGGGDEALPPHLTEGEYYSSITFKICGKFW